MVDNVTETQRVKPLLEVHNLSVRFGRHWVLRDVNLSVLPGQTVAVIGESGCGKTVFLKCLIGLIRPTQGEVLFEGRNLFALPAKELNQLRTRYGFVFQNAALFDSLTVGENVAFPLQEHTNYSRQRIWEIVVSRLADVGLPESVMSKRPAELSGGMRKRVGLARALVLNPELILYDEPTTGLDPIMSDVINELILQTRLRFRVTSVIVTHDMSSVRKVADRVVMLYPVHRLHPGEPQVVFDGPPSALERAEDRRVVQFVRGEAGERLLELRNLGSGAWLWTSGS